MIEQDTGAGEPRTQMRTFIRQRIEQAVPLPADGAKSGGRQQHTQDRPIRLHDL